MTTTSQGTDRQTTPKRRGRRVAVLAGVVLLVTAVGWWYAARPKWRVRVVPNVVAKNLDHLAVSSGGSLLALAAADHSIAVVDSATGHELVFLQEETDVEEMEFSPDGRLLAAALDDGTVTLWDASTGEPRARLPYDGDVRHIFFSPEGSIVAAALRSETPESCIFRLWDASTGKERTQLPMQADDSYDLESAILSRDAGTLAVVRDAEDGNEVTELWDVREQRLSATLGGDMAELLWPTFSHDDAFLAAAPEHGSRVRVWNVVTGRLERTLVHPAREVVLLSFSPDGETLTTISAQERVSLRDRFPLLDRLLPATEWPITVSGHIWDWKSGTEIARCTTEIDWDVVQEIAIASDRRTGALSFDDGRVRLYQLPADW